MTIIALVPAVVALVAAFAYAFASHPKLLEIARIVFFCAFLAFMIALSTSSVRVDRW